ncbi:hypothetical protein BC831DRAFT_514401 [Entophlyctis helioformis]|nr:hypothetical protein BC831DRAFT_514401 [Entophlyctis helioformis]
MHRSSVAAVALLVSCSSLASAAVVQVSALAGPSCTAVLSSSTVQASLAGAPIQCLPGTVSISAAASAAAAAVASAAVDAAAAQHPSSSFYVLSPTNQTLDAFACPSVACAQPAACTKVFTASQADPQTGPQSGEQAGQQASCPLSFQFLDDSTTSKLPVNIIGRTTSSSGTAAGASAGVIGAFVIFGFIGWYGTQQGWWSEACGKSIGELPKTAQDINNQIKGTDNGDDPNTRQPQAQAAPQTSEEAAIAMTTAVVSAAAVGVGKMMMSPQVPEKDLPKAPKSGKKTAKKAAGTRTTKKKSKAVVDDDAAAEEEVEDVAPAATPKRKAKPVVQKDEPVEEEVEYVAPTTTPRHKTKPAVQKDEPVEEIATPKPVKTAKAAPRAAPAPVAPAPVAVAPAASAVPKISSAALSKPAPVVASSKVAAAAAEPAPVRRPSVRAQQAAQPASTPAPVASRAAEPQPQPTRARRAAVQAPVDDNDDDDDDTHHSGAVPARTGYYDEFGLLGEPELAASPAANPAASPAAATARVKPVAAQPRKRI